jgi:hypothetical protein
MAIAITVSAMPQTTIISRTENPRSTSDRVRIFIAESLLFMLCLDHAPDPGAVLDDSD